VTCLLAHERRIVERVADGQVPIVGHGSQEHALGAPKAEEEVDLHDAAHKGDCLLW